MLLVLNCEHYSPQWLFGMAKAMRYSGGVRVMKDCQQPVSLHSSFNADPAPLVDEVEHYVKTNCEFEEGEPSSTIPQKKNSNIKLSKCLAGKSFNPQVWNSVKIPN